MCNKLQSAAIGTGTGTTEYIIIPNILREEE